MSKPPRDRTCSSSNTYFVTLSAYQRQSLFQSIRVTELFLSTLFSYRDQNKFLVHEFVVMPNHVHLLITPQSRVTLERAIQFINGGFSFRAGKRIGNQERNLAARLRRSSNSRCSGLQPPPKLHLVKSGEGASQRQRSVVPFSSASGASHLDSCPSGAKAPCPCDRPKARLKSCPPSLRSDVVVRLSRAATSPGDALSLLN